MQNIMAVLTTARLTMTPVTAADLPALTALHADPDTGGRLKHGVLTAAQTAALVTDYAAGWQALGFGMWTLRERAGGAFVGLAGLWLHDAGHGIALRGAVLPEARSRGFMAEAITAAIDYGFGRIGLDRIVAISRADNLAARRGALRAGMALEREFEGDGGVRLVLHVLTRQSWSHGGR